MHFDFVFERELNFDINGKRSRGKLLVGGIDKDDSATESFWVCYWSLDEIHPTKGRIYGIDPLDALINCMEFLKTLIERHNAIGYRISWNEEGDQGGLIPPVKNASP